MRLPTSLLVGDAVKRAIFGGEKEFSEVEERANELTAIFAVRGVTVIWKWMGAQVAFYDGDKLLGAVDPDILMSEGMANYISGIRNSRASSIPGIPVFIENVPGRMNQKDWHSVCMKIAQAKPEPMQSFWLALAQAMPNAQIFDFGLMPNAQIIDLAARAGPLMAAKFLDLPYQAVVFEYKVISNEKGKSQEPIRTVTLACRVSDFTAMKLFEMGEEPTGLILAADFCEFGDEGHPARLALIGALAFRTSRKNGGQWEGAIIDTLRLGEDDDDEARRAQRVLEGVADGVAALSLLLSTKGVETRTETPSRKFQEKRAKRGKPSAPTVTYVNTKHYLAAARNSVEKGHHSSPVPHLRRGHMRTYKAGKTVTGRMIHRDRAIWIKDMIVNATTYDEVAKRDHYEINKADHKRIPV